MMIPRFFLVVFLLSALTVTGCGYTKKTVLPQDIKTIYVDTVRNEIPVKMIYAYQPGVEIQLTKEIIRNLNIDGRVKVVTREDADAVLETSLIEFIQEGTRFTSLESVEQYRLFIVVKMKLINSRTKQVIWQEDNFSGDAEYFVSTLPDVSLQQATEAAIVRLASNVTNRIVEDW